MKTCKDDSLGIDFTLDSIKNVKDMINQIKLVNPNYSVANIFKKLSNKFIRNRTFKTIGRKKIKNQQNYIPENNGGNDLA